MTDVPIRIDTAIAATSSPLGRYDPTPGTAAGPQCEVRLLGVPVELFLASRQQHDDLVREFAVMGLAHEDADPREPAGLRELISEFGVHYARSTARTYVQFEEAQRLHKDRIDLVFHVSPSVVAAADRLEALMGRADEYCAQGLMLTMPRTPKMRLFAAWWLGELRRQIGGDPPQPWSAG